MVKCPICEKGILKKTKERKIFYGVDLGEYPVEKCTKCGETFTDAEVMRKIEKIAKKKGIWGLAKKTKITRTGNSLAVRIPKNIVNFLKLKEGEEAYIHPEDHKLIIEATKS